jgi:hypothetical protein
MLSIASDEGASSAERASDFEQGRKMLNRSVIAPQTIYRVLEGRVRMIEA